MSTLLQDLRYGVRMLAKSPGFTAVAVIALALGVGANTAIFSVVNAVLLRPLPFADAEHLVIFRQGGERTERLMTSMSYPDFEDYGRLAQSLEHVAAYSQSSAKLTGAGSGDEPESLEGAIVSASMFPLLGVEPAIGRAFGAEEDKQGASPVIVLGHALWRNRFNSDPRVVGTEIMIADRPTTVVGVMPAGFKFPLEADRIDYWMPLAANPDTAGMLPNRGLSYIRVVARTRPGVAPAQAQAEVSSIVRSFAAQFPQSHKGRTVHLTPLHGYLVGNVRTALWVLLAAVGFVLLIACANVANLLLARAASR
ncbi:MAG: ABC transporter permease, partial [Pyrinomonadaceae bacterium]